ncbi:MAG: phage Gp37/Gp68 family protein [Sterolibacterium sp.]
MSENTKIEWCHATVNHWAGCTAVSPACDHCYAKRMAGRLWGTEWGTGKPRHQFLGANATLIALDRKANRLGKPLMVFHNSLSDFFDNEVPVQWRISAMRAIVDTPNLIHILLTKRIGNAAVMLEQAFRAVHGQREGWSDNILSNVWLGATICNQEEADRDIPKLLSAPASVRFLSIEPMLGPVELDHIDLNGDLEIYPLRGTTECVNGEGEPIADIPRIDWVIVGGESGPSARPMHPDWARSLRDQCQAAGVPFLFKQWGEWAPYDYLDAETKSATQAKPWQRSNGSDFDRGLVRIGKKAAGRHLDGRTWDGVPT